MSVIDRVRSILDPVLPDDAQGQTVFEILHREHDEVKDLMALIEVSYDGDDPDSEARRVDRIRHMDELWRALHPHMKAEETTLYARMNEMKGDMREISLEATQEHRIVLQLVDELHGGARPNDLWTAKFKVLKDHLLHHITDEEERLWPVARRVLSTREQVDLARAYEAARDPLRAQLGRMDQKKGTPRQGEGAERHAHGR